MRKVTCEHCGRRRPRTRMHFNHHTSNGVTQRYPTCGMLTCLEATNRKKAQNARKMRGDVAFSRLLMAA